MISSARPQLSEASASACRTCVTTSSSHNTHVKGVLEVVFEKFSDNVSPKKDSRSAGPSAFSFPRQVWVHKFSSILSGNIELIIQFIM